jgi:Angiotensin-converting enzyme
LNFSFGECNPSSGNPKPMSIVGIFRRLAKSRTMGIDPPERMNTVCLPNGAPNAPPPVRTEQDFDPAAKYHVVANVPYMRYFLADILQFQFHRALSQVAGCTEPLNRCSIYQNRAPGTD